MVVAECVGWMEGLEAPALPRGDVFTSRAGSTPALRLFAHPWTSRAPQQGEAGISWVTQAAQLELRRSGPGWY